MIEIERKLITSDKQSISYEYQYTIDVNVNSILDTVTMSIKIVVLNFHIVLLFNFLSIDLHYIVILSLFNYCYT